MLPEYGFAAVSDDPLPLEAYPHRRAIPTRWRDNDVYGHVNNVECYSYFDTVINAYLIDEGGLDIQSGAVIGLFREGEPLATGWFVHVFVDRASRRPVAIPDPLRSALAALASS